MVDKKSSNDMEEKVINTIRKLALDEIAEANSGHPGIALGIAPMLYAVYKNAKINPRDSNWFNRDRIVMSCGHGSSVLYSTLYMFGYKLELDDLKSFRKLGSLTPGHPEHDVTDGVDASTGALGQGFATAVGLALAESHIAAKFNKKDAAFCDHNTFVLCGDGDLMEGISYEAMNIAGKFKLNKLIALYDSNNITMTDKMDLVSCEDTKKRFESANWNVLEVVDGENHVEIEDAIKKAQKSKDKPSIIICKTTIGYKSKLAGSSKCHGKPFTKEETAEICQNLGVSCVPFDVDEDALKYCQKLQKIKEKEYVKWQEVEKQYKEKYKQDYGVLFNGQNKMLAKLNSISFDKDIATREAGGIILNKLAEKANNLFGGGADVAKSTMAYINDGGDFSSDSKTALNIPYGIREHAMSAIANGIALHGGLQTFASTFLIFSDYMKYGIRQSALMDLPVWYVLSHDSIYLGEDGPSHQPIEQVASLRLIPNLMVIRPADANETKMAFAMAIKSKKPTAFILSRQKLPLIKTQNVEDALKGGYVLSKESKKLDAILIASGSEVSLCLEAKQKLKEKNIDVRVVSMPCMEEFLKQDKTYQNKVLPKTCNKRVCVDVGASDPWFKFVKNGGIVMGINSFGESGNGKEIASLFGITSEMIVKNVKKLVK